MMVSVAIFAIVMLIGIGALLSLVSANKRAQSLNSVMNNLNFALESMSRTIRVGSTYHCTLNPNDLTGLTDPQDCASGGGKLVAFEESGGDPEDSGDQVVYRVNGSRIERSLAAGLDGTWVAVTAPEVSIENMEFFVVGSYPQSGVPSDALQPRVLIKIQGSAAVAGSEPSAFNIQAAVTQRILDL
jgi:type II secretory pathway component PulJ